MSYFNKPRNGEIDSSFIKEYKVYEDLKRNAPDSPQPNLQPIINQTAVPVSSQYHPIGGFPQTQQSVPPITNAIPTSPSIQTIQSLEDSKSANNSDFRIEYNDLEPAMYLCETSVQGTLNGTQETNSFSHAKVISRTNRSTADKRKPISSGCAQFNRLIDYSDELAKDMLCEIRITSRTTKFLNIRVKDIFAQEKSVKDRLAECGVCFIDNKGFNMWCADIARHINNVSSISTERKGYYKEDGKWYCKDIEQQSLDVSFISAINSLCQRLTDLQNDAFEDLTLILCGLIGKMFTVLKYEKISELANIILISHDTYKAENDLKIFFAIDDNELFDDSGKSLKALKSCCNTVPIITLSDKLPQNKYALEHIAKAKDLNCFPLILAENKDNITKINSTKHFVVIRYNSISDSNIRIIIELFHRQLLSKDNFIEEINRHMGSYIQLFSDSGTNIMLKTQNLYSLLFSLIHIILPDFQVSNMQLIYDHYFKYLTSDDSKQDIDIDKLKYILTSDSTFKRVNKKTAESLEDSFLYYSDKSIYLSSTTMSQIAERFGFSNVNRFTEILNDNELLTSSKGTTMNVVNIRGKSVRGYTLDINSIFKQGDFIPNCNEYCLPEYSIPIGLIDFYRSVNFTAGENENNMMYISGKSRSGKTNFCNVLSTQAAMKDMSVVMIGNSRSIVDLGLSAKEYVINDLTSPISWKKIDHQGQITKVTVSDGASISVNDILNSFLNDHKFLRKADEKVFTLLVLDEVSEFSWDEKTPIRELLRKGSKYGISALLSTQYLNSKNGANMSDALKQCSSFCFFEDADIPTHLSKKHPELNNCVQDLNKYESILIGNFTVDNIPVKNPLRLKTYKL